MSASPALKHGFPEVDVEPHEADEDDEMGDVEFGDVDFDDADIVDVSLSFVSLILNNEELVDFFVHHILENFSLFYNNDMPLARLILSISFVAYVGNNNV
uniref:Uncharacterized protein n=1 Tax=Glossina palpalis gambiensis TaxID=67801 RepID=A0A1B0BVL1_9MUSC